MRAWVLMALAVAGCADAAVVAQDAEVAAPDAAGVAPDADVMAPDADVMAPDAGAEADAGIAPADAAAPTDAGAIAAPVRYTADRTLSPLTPGVAANLRAIWARAANLRDRVFAKVGASSTVSTHFLHCFAGPNVDLGGRAELQATVDWFRAGDAMGTTPFDRTSLAATVGWSAGAALAGNPSPLERELDAIQPRWAIVMFGTNDVERRDVFSYADHMLDLTDLLIARGVIPVLSTFMPRDDDPDADAQVPRHNAAVRAVAQARQVPFVDYHKELLPLPDHGLGPDHIHAAPYQTPAGPRACFLTQAGLQFGYNVRNLLVLQTLHRLRETLIAGAPAPDDDATAPHLAGAGTAAAPYRVTALPFTDARDTTRDGERRVDRYPGCNASQDESGREVVYRLELDHRATVRAMVFDRGTVDVDLHLLEGASCRARAHQQIVEDLTPGTYDFVLDTFVSNGTEHAGEYLFALMEEP